MPRGRPPKPTELKRKDGNPGKRPLPDTIVASGKVATLQPPAHLPETAVEVWNEVTPELANIGLLDGVDGLMLESLCIHVARAREAGSIIAKDGMYLSTTRGGLTLHPAVRVERDSWDMARKIATEFALTPVARTRLGLALYRGKTLQNELEEKLTL